MSDSLSLTYEDILMGKLRPHGVVFLSILVMDGPDITKFIAPQNFIDAYLDQQLYNQDPTLILPQENIGFYNWDRFIDGEKITNLIGEKFKATIFESLVLTQEKKRLVLTVGCQKEFSLSEWFFKENPNLDHLLE